MNLDEKKIRLREFAKKSIIEDKLAKESALREKEATAHKTNSIKYALLAGIFIWFCLGLVTKNIINSAAVSILISVILFVLFLINPVIKNKAHAKRVEADLPDFLTKIVYELRSGKSFLESIRDSTNEENYAAKEFQIVINEIVKGSSFSSAIERMNKKLSSVNIRRANSNLYNIWAHGTNNSDGLKRLTQELLLKQRIESKEYSSKMVVYSLVFIAVSAIVPAMFQSFMLIGSYFMKISLTPMQVLMIIVVVFPVIDIAILSIINSKTPLFLRR